MRKGTRHPNAKAVSLHGKPGRPKALPPVPKAPACETCRNLVITKAKKGGLHNHRQILSFLGDQEIAAKLMDEIGPRYADRPGGYTRVLKLGPRQGDNAPMARIELV